MRACVFAAAPEPPGTAGSAEASVFLERIQDRLDEPTQKLRQLERIKLHPHIHLRSLGGTANDALRSGRL